MANVYVEARPKGRPEGDRIDDYVIEDHADNVLGTFKTQKEAIDWPPSRPRHAVCASCRAAAFAGPLFGGITGF